MSTNESTDEFSEDASQGDPLTKLNVLSLLVQAGYALRNGNKRRAALLFGTATIAPRYKRSSYVIQAALTANDLRRKVTRSDNN